MTSEPLVAATAAATETLLNCYVREAERWQVRNRVLTIPIADGATELRAKIQHLSSTRRHRYLLPVELATSEGATPIGFTAVAGLLLDELSPGSHPMQPTVLMSRMLESLHEVASFLEVRQDDLEQLWSATPLTFIESEQSLLLGHPLHPTPKSREPMSEAERLRYSPETKSRFPLHWLAADPDLVAHRSATGTPAPVLSEQLARSCGVPELLGLRKRVLLPAHPWELAHLRRQPDIATLFARGGIIDLGTFGDPVAPTTSVRTVYRSSWPWQLKFSLHVRVTNSMRVTLPKELDRAVEAAALWRTEVGEAAARIAPTFTCIHDPAYLTIIDRDQPLDGFSVLFRENLWPAGCTSNVTSLTSLCQEHPLGGPSRLARIVQHLAGRGSRPVANVGGEWFVRFLDVALAPLLRLYRDLGLCFEAHQQNTLLELDTTGAPVRCFYRDSQGYFHRELAHTDLCKVTPALGEATESIFPEALAAERLAYYLVVNLTLGVVDALAAAGCGDEEALLTDLRRCLETERSRAGRYPPTLVERLLDGDHWPCKANLRTRLHDMDELVGDIAEQSVYVTIPNPLPNLTAPATRGSAPV